MGEGGGREMASGGKGEGTPNCESELWRHAGFVTLWRAGVEVGFSGLLPRAHRNLLEDGGGVCILFQQTLSFFSFTSLLFPPLPPLSLSQII